MTLFGGRLSAVPLIHMQGTPRLLGIVVLSSGERGTMSVDARAAQAITRFAKQMFGTASSTQGSARSSQAGLESSV